MTSNAIYEPHYSDSKALIIGINQYQNGSPLDYACNDAKVVADTLVDTFDFPSENVILLQDEEASRENILARFLDFASEDINADERIIVFFAGHGYTRVGKRGEVGFLVPYDGDVENINSLIRWDELTGNAELISAKHILFIMDACYGGTAVQRYLPPGSMRFARDMLRRYSRQVLTAGKADEVVADAGGPRPGHSVFTGHLLDGLDGAAASTDGLITANGIMSYVYDRVSKDYQSNQTPHYGFLDGDGDMILDLSPLEDIEDKPETDQDILVEVPASVDSQQNEQGHQSLPDQIKEYLSDDKFRIKLHDMVMGEVRSVLAQTSEERFPVQGASATKEEIVQRLSKYEEVVSGLSTIVLLLARWGDQGHRKTLEQLFSRLPDTHSTGGGLTLFLGLRWYPINYLSYIGGIGALAADDYENLSAILMAPAQTAYSEDVKPMMVPMVDGMLDVTRAEAFKSLPGHERHYVPRSEYLLKAVQPNVDDLLFLGKDFERLFDRYEVLLALLYAHLSPGLNSSVWGPPGRFAWKYSNRDGRSNPFESLIQEASQQQNAWGPLRAGMFDGSMARFEEVANGYRELLKELRWY